MATDRRAPVCSVHVASCVVPSRGRRGGGPGRVWRRSPADLRRRRVRSSHRDVPRARLGRRERTVGRPMHAVVRGVHRCEVVPVSDRRRCGSRCRCLRDGGRVSRRARPPRVDLSGRLVSIGRPRSGWARPDQNSAVVAFWMSRNRSPSRVRRTGSIHCMHASVTSSVPTTSSGVPVVTSSRMRPEL